MPGGVGGGDWGVPQTQSRAKLRLGVSTPPARCPGQGATLLRCRLLVPGPSPCASCQSLLDRSTRSKGRRPCWLFYSLSPLHALFLQPSPSFTLPLSAAHGFTT